MSIIHHIRNDYSVKAIKKPKMRGNYASARNHSKVKNSCLQIKIQTCCGVRGESKRPFKAATEYSEISFCHDQCLL